MILYLKDSKNTKILLDIIKNFSKVPGYKMNLQKSVPFLYTNNEQFEKEHRKIILFTIVSNKIKYLGKNLTKYVNDLYQENYKPLKKETKNYRIWKALSCSCIGRINIVKM
jgi:hypothetical protein